MALAKYRALPLTVLGALLLGAPAHADWTLFGGNPEHAFNTSEKVTAPLSVSWKHATNLVAQKGGNHGGPVIEQGTVYFPSKNRVYAVDAASGELRWKVPEADSNDVSIPNITCTPAVGAGFVYVGDASGHLTAYSVADGAQGWSFATGGGIRSAPVLVGDSLYFGSDDNYVYCLNARTGDLKWKSNEGPKKDLQLSDNAVGSPVVYSGVVYINSSDMKLYALDASNGRVLWSQRMAAPTLGISPVAYNGRIYMAAGSTIYQFRLRGGSFRAWSLQDQLENDIATTPIITDNGWYFADNNGYFYAFTPQGKPMLNEKGEKFKVKLEGKPQGNPVMTADTIYVTTEKGFVYGIDPVKGKVTWSYRTEAPKGIQPLYSYYALRGPLAVSDGRLYMLGDDGTLTCMSPTAQDDEGPVMVAPKPARGTLMNGYPPIYFSAYIWDEGSGVNPDTIEVMLDGVPVDKSDKEYYDRIVAPRKGWIYDPVKRLITFSTLKAEKGEKEEPLTDGVHRVQVQAADWRGNVNSLDWTFVVDNALPRNAVAIKPKTPGKPGANQPGGAQNGQFRGNNRFGGYQYNNRGGGQGYNFGRGGGQGGYGGGQGGYGGGGQGGYGGGRGGFGGGGRGGYR